LGLGWFTNGIQACEMAGWVAAIRRAREIANVRKLFMVVFL
jgi:hypothetical protein